ncbi:Threonine/homoserine/homoserine lactone efflux protein [Rhizobiales bacterium GAS113]|nr:Threonine/homoserine/homoserine lactone efflux protein [Rhizobiales bacterium GAS113]
MPVPSLDAPRDRGFGPRMNATIPTLLGYGFLLGWSVAWPPGPINAEIARRALARGFWAAYGLILGATCGDMIWALLVAFGIGVLLQGRAMQLALGALSVTLLLALAFVFLRGAWRSFAGAQAPPARFEGGRAGFVLGLTLALTSPWNIAFWLAVIGRPEIAQQGLQNILVVIAGVMAAALLWGFVWSGVVLQLRHAASGRTWEVGVKTLTGLLMLYFAGASILRLLGG